MHQGVIRYSSLLLGLALGAGTYAAADAQEPPGWTPAQRQVWPAVESRWDAWVARDSAAFRAAHHPQWRRWAFAAPPLMARADLSALWAEFQEQEEYVGVRLEPIAVELVDGARTAAVHYVAHAQVRWIGEPFTSATGRRVKRGDETVVPVRWSDFLVWKGGRWLYLGGYRDGNCALWPGYGRPCRTAAAVSEQPG